MANQPVHRIRFGNISASIFANQKDDRSYHSVSFQRSWKDGDSWQHSTSFFRDDLLALAELSREAFRWIHNAKKTDEAGDGK